MILLISENETIFATIDRAGGTVVASVQVYLLDQFVTGVGVGDDIDSALEQAARDVVPSSGSVGLSLQEYINDVESKLSALNLN